MTTAVFQVPLNFKNFIVVRKLNMRSTLNRFLIVQYSVLSQHLPMVRSGPSHTSLFLELLAFSSGYFSVIGLKSARNRGQIQWTGPDLTIGTVLYIGSLKLILPA